MRMIYSGLPVLLALISISSFSQSPLVIDLHNSVNNKNIQVFNRELSLISEESHSGIRLSKNEGEGVAWLKALSSLMVCWNLTYGEKM